MPFSQSTPQTVARPLSLLVMASPSRAEIPSSPRTHDLGGWECGWAPPPLSRASESRPGVSCLRSCPPRRVGPAGSLCRLGGVEGSHSSSSTVVVPVVPRRAVAAVAVTGPGHRWRGQGVAADEHLDDALNGPRAHQDDRGQPTHEEEAGSAGLRRPVTQAVEADDDHEGGCRYPEDDQPADLPVGPSSPSRGAGRRLPTVRARACVCRMARRSARCVAASS